MAVPASFTRRADARAYTAALSMGATMTTVVADILPARQAACRDAVVVYWTHPLSAALAWFTVPARWYLPSARS
jgi:hypothetical protein